MPYIIYVELEILIKKVDGYASNSEKSSTTELGEHVPCGYSMWTKWSFDNIKNFISWKRLYEKL